MAQPDPMALMAQMLHEMQVANQNTNQMIQQNQQAQESRDAALRQALDVQREATTRSVRALSEALAKVTTKDKGVVDVKGVGKPEMLQGETKEQIIFKTEMAFVAIWLHDVVCLPV